MEQMNITSARYVAIGGENNIMKATIDGVEYAVPLSDTNRHYAEILRQVEAGELVIEEAE